MLVLQKTDLSLTIRCGIQIFPNLNVFDVNHVTT